MKRRLSYIESCAIKGYSHTLGIELTMVHEIVANMIFALEIDEREVLQIAQEISATAKSFTSGNLPIDEKICLLIDEKNELNESVQDVRELFLNTFEKINIMVNKFFKMLYMNRDEDVKCYLKNKHRKVTNAIESCKFLILSIVDYYLENVEMQ